MKTLLVLFVALFCLSFCPNTEKEEYNTKAGYYIFIEDHTSNTNHKFLVESKDSVDIIFERFFDSELSLGNVDYPISIYNLKHDFYIERVTLFEAKNGKTKFKHLKYPAVYDKNKRTPRGTSVF
jgi:hypothetical protein